MVNVSYFGAHISYLGERFKNEGILQKENSYIKYENTECPEKYIGTFGKQKVKPVDFTF